MGPLCSPTTVSPSLVSFPESGGKSYTDTGLEDREESRNERVSDTDGDRGRVLEGRD